MEGPIDPSAPQTSSRGVVLKPEIGIFLDLMRAAGLSERIRYNVMRDRAEVFASATGTWRAWNDGDDSRLRLFFQQRYGISHRNNLDDAFRILLDTNRVNPLTDLLLSLEWDGVSRIDRFLVDTVACDDTPYNHEVSRLIFAQGVARAFDPGCKCDDMPVLVGSQGSGKSTLVRWLNMDDSFFKEVKTISGKEGIEAISGVWIGEVAELMAMTRVKESEAVKAFITSQEDSYRAPYDRHTKTIPRRCIFIGTTNNALFLNDKTGNRRFYPVECHSTGYDLFDRADEIHLLIKQCWAEAVHKYLAGELKPFADRSLIYDIRAAQESAMEDDWRAGMISEYLEKKNVGDKVCVIEIWYYALNMDEKTRPDRKDSIEISQIISSIPGWVRQKNAARSKWGFQKHFVKVENVLPEKPEDCPF